MLNLDDPLWEKLQHAYGAATDTPALLAKLSSKRGLTPKFWDDLWGSLCHQYCTYTASYAAFPHLVYAAKNLGNKQRVNAMRLAAGILACSGYEGSKLPNEIPAKLRKPFRAAIADGRSLLVEMMDDKRKSDTDCVDYLWTIAAFDGHPEVVSILWTVIMGDLGCPDCGRSLSGF